MQIPKEISEKTQQIIVFIVIMLCILVMGFGLEGCTSDLTGVEISRLINDDNKTHQTDSDRSNLGTSDDNMHISGSETDNKNNDWHISGN